jgi:hypothetical protein
MAAQSKLSSISTRDVRISLGFCLIGFIGTLAVTSPSNWWMNDNPGGKVLGSLPQALSIPKSRPRSPLSAPAANVPVAATLPVASAAPDRSADPQTLPIRVSFPYDHRSRGRALRITAFGAGPLTVEVEVSNEATGKDDQRAITLNQPTVVILGQPEGWKLEPGDAVKVHADGYAEFMLTM